VQNAQNAGAAAVIVANDDVAFPGPLPFMTAGAEGALITIPSMLIYGDDGAVLKSHLNVSFGLSVSMSYFLPNPDDRVEFDLFTSAVDTLTDTFKRQWPIVVQTLGDKALFTPHYQILNGGLGFSCQPAWFQSCSKAVLDSRCGNRCTNCGRYCQNDPDLDPSKGASGTDVVLEQARLKCVWKWGNQTEARTLWFDYVNGHAAACASAPHQFDATCSMTLIRQLGVPDDFMTACLGGAGAISYTSSAHVDVLEEDLLWMQAYQPLPPPELFVNDQPYRGSLSCPDPISPGSCAPLGMVCAGFADGTAPITCAATNCAIGVLPDRCGICGGDNSTCRGCDGVVLSGKVFDACGSCKRPDWANFTRDSSDCPSVEVPSSGGSKGFPVGAVIGVVIAAVVLIGGGVYLYMRRQQAVMKDDIDQLLRQYLPLDGPVTAVPDKRIVDRRALMSDDEHAGLTNIQQATSP